MRLELRNIVEHSLKERRNRRSSRQSGQAITSAWPTFSQPSFGLAVLVHLHLHCSPIMALLSSTNLAVCATSIWHVHVASHTIVQYSHVTCKRQAVCPGLRSCPEDLEQRS